MSYSLGFTGEEVNDYLMMCQLLAQIKHKKDEKDEKDEEVFYTENIVNSQGNTEKQYILNRFLSEKNFSESDKTKLDSVESGANNYTLPDASATVKGGIKLGEGLELSEDKVTVNVTRPIVPRSRLATEALFAPVTQIGESPHTLSAEDIGCMLCNGTGNNLTISLTATASKSLPIGTEISITDISEKGINIDFNGVKVGMAGDTGYFANGETKTVSLLEQFGIITLKKIMNDGTHDIWLISGSIRK